jgi:integrase
MLIEQGLSPKQVQHRMGHASLQMTMDLYGHLWPDPDADRRSAQATERIILGAQ